MDGLVVSGLVVVVFAVGTVVGRLVTDVVGTAVFVVVAVFDVEIGESKIFEFYKTVKI